MRKRWTITLEILVLSVLCVWTGFYLYGGRTPRNAVDLKIQLKGAHDKALLLRQPDGKNADGTPRYAYRYRITLDDGSQETLDPPEFARRIYEDQRRRTWGEVLCNVTSSAGYIWVAIGLLGQVLFTGRMIVQWLASEKEKASVVPVSFWWMSLLAGTMLLVYFAWRGDPVGVLGQAFGWAIYVRNLWFIYVPHKPETAQVGEDPAPEPELNK